MKIKLLTNRAEITIPTSHVDPAFTAELCRIAGGVTTTESQGVWLDAAGVAVSEPVTVYVVYYSDEAIEDIEIALAGEVFRLFDAGEQAVIVVFSSVQGILHDKN